MNPGFVKFETNYQQLTDPPSSVPTLIARSGNPGYQMGKPLVVARFNSTGANGSYQSLKLFPNSASKSRTILFGVDSFQVKTYLTTILKDQLTIVNFNYRFCKLISDLLTHRIGRNGALLNGALSFSNSFGAKISVRTGK